jgi:hypothetical protein
MFADLLPVAAEGGLLGVVVTVFGLLHRSATRAAEATVHAYREQTADWRTTARLEREAHDETRRQLLHVLAPLRTTAESAP